MKPPSAARWALVRGETPPYQPWIIALFTRGIELLEQLPRRTRLRVWTWHR